MADQFDYENSENETEEALAISEDADSTTEEVHHDDIEDMPLVDKVGRMSGLLHRYTKNQAEAHGRFGDPLRGQGRVLTLLKAKPETSQRELGFLLDMRQQSLSELLAKLEEKGFITREKSEDDGRVMMVKLTEEGAAAAPDVQDMDPNADVFDCLSEEERNQFEDAVVKVTKSLEQKLIDMGDDPNARPRSNRDDRGARGGHDDRGGRGGFRGGRDDHGGRGGYRGGRDDRRGGFRGHDDDRRGGYRGGRDDRGGRGGFRRDDDRRGGYRGGRDDRGGYRSSNSSFYPSRSERNNDSEE